MAAGVTTAGGRQPTSAIQGPALLSTRPQGEQDRLVARLRAEGFRVLAVPTVATEPLAFPVPDLASFDWVVLTSATGVAALLERAAPAPGGRPRWAAVGPKTAAALASRGLASATLPEQSRGVLIAEAIARTGPLGGQRVLLARADAAAADLPEALRRAGAEVVELAVYRTVVGPERSRELLNRALGDPGLAAVLFASGSAVQGLLKLAEEDPRHLPAITIGPSTSRVARELGFEVAAEASRPGVEEMVEAVCRLRGLGSA